MVNIPDTLKYTKEHEWVKVDGDTAVIGITDHAQSELGEVVFVEFPSVGTALTKGQDFGVVESVKTVSNLYAPISGEIIEVNSDLESIPDKINSDPYDGGWIIKIKITDNSELEQLFDAESYTQQISE